MLTMILLTIKVTSFCGERKHPGWRGRDCVASNSRALLKATAPVSAAENTTSKAAGVFVGHFDSKNGLVHYEPVVGKASIQGGVGQDNISG